mmetsp:Transcript_32229/g.79097  ORF Transcript_32229/g.79097 Transcript_32229/m.79097 type:complete len:269 (-) Transcript_32229:659-1465(-)
MAMLGGPLRACEMSTTSGSFPPPLRPWHMHSVSRPNTPVTGWCDHSKRTTPPIGRFPPSPISFSNPRPRIPTLPGPPSRGSGVLRTLTRKGRVSKLCIDTRLKSPDIRPTKYGKKGTEKPNACIELARCTHGTPSGATPSTTWSRTKARMRCSAPESRKLVARSTVKERLRNCTSSWISPGLAASAPGSGGGTCRRAPRSCPSSVLALATMPLPDTALDEIWNDRRSRASNLSGATALGSRAHVSSMCSLSPCSLSLAACATSNWTCT